jgi:hypothetical protein
MVNLPVNATGWDQLMAGSPVQAAFYMFNTALAGWVIILLFFVFQFMLYAKMRNATTNLITGLFFTALYLGGKLGAQTTAGMATMSILLALEIGGVLYFIFTK